MNANAIESILKRLSIIEKAEVLAWYKDVNFGDGVVVNIDKSGNGVEHFCLTHADINDVYGYPVSGFYGPNDTDTLSSWGCGNVPIIERDASSADLESALDIQLRHYNISRDNPVIQRYHPNLKN